MLLFHFFVWSCLSWLTFCKLTPRRLSERDGSSSGDAAGAAIASGMSMTTDGSSANAAATTTSAAAPAQTTICGDIIDAVNDGYTIFFASDAYDCLTSVPFNPAVATRFINYLNTTYQFQSTLAYLRNPPPGYQQPAVDVLQRLQQIQQNVTAGYYQNEYAFEADLQLLVYSLHDEHVSLNAGVLFAFSFASPYSISSASVDGKQAPGIYITDDIIASQQEGWQPSPIASINGEDAVEYLTQFAALNSAGTLEPNADWNQLMDTPALDIQGFLPVFSGAATFYPGDSLNFTFANGTELDTYWLAIYNNPDPTGPLTTGGDFYNYFVLGLYPASFNASESDNTSNAGNSTSADNSTSTDNSTAGTSWFDASSGAYPANPDVAQEDLTLEGGGVVSGYFLNDTSTGVLSLPTFDQYDWNVGNFSSTVSDFISGAQSNSISRVIIDLQQNSGGNIELAFDTFKQFFPDVDPFAGSRRRIQALANAIGIATTNYWDGLQESDPDYADLAADEWVITDRINAATSENFTSWEEYAGPVVDNGDTFSLTERYNLSSTVFDAAAFSDWIPYGYTDYDPVQTTRPWDPQHIIILTDGLCSSACALLVEMMTQVGVRTVAVGGRPTTGPMQAVSGSRGALVYSSDELDTDIMFASSINQTSEAILPQNRNDTGVFITYAGFNLRDQVRLGDNTPLQFKYEAADCRIYYTLANAYNMSRLWRDVASAAWDNPSLCVADSTGYPTATNTSSSTKPPPALTAEISSLDLHYSEHVDFEVDETGGLPDARQAPARSVQIGPCNANGGCNDGISQCRSILVTCQTGSKRQVNACLPPCQNRDGSDSCGGGNTFCNLVATQDSKVNTQKSKVGGVVKFAQTLRTGFCVPRAGTPALGCPA